jgi:hypothetical protein
MHVQPDHLVVVCDTLAQGREWCQSTLGAEPQLGGGHDWMGTHNLLLDVSSPTQAQVYLELIAIDPDATPPSRPRWFGMDEPGLRALVAQTPQLVAWVGRSPQVDMHRWGLITVGQQVGPIVPCSRSRADGSVLSWQIVVREDGRRLLDGALPVLIEWKGEHPCDRLAKSSVRLDQLVARGLPQRAIDVMRLRGVTRPGDAGPALQVELETTQGRRLLASPAW